MRIFTLLFILTTGFVQAQTTAIPDSNFEKSLIFWGFDTGMVDGFVPTANIDTITTLSIANPFDIVDLTGI